MRVTWLAVYLVVIIAAWPLELWRYLLLLAAVVALLWIDREVS